MAGVWETLFYEEKQDWITTIINGVSSLTCCAVEIPCAILALISTCLIMSWEFACQSAQQVSDFLGLEEWWTLEHSLWAFFLLQGLPVMYKRAGGEKLHMLLQLAFMSQLLCLWGSFIWMLNALQGGIVFGGKLFHPSIFFIGLAIQVIMMTFKQLRKDMAGFGYDKQVKDERFNEVFKVYEICVKYEVAFAILVGVFGLPKFDLNADPTNWLSLVPIIGMTYNYKTFLAVIIPPAKKSETNGVPPQVAEEKKAEEPAAAKPAEPAKKEEPKKEEAKEGEKSEKAEKAEKAETAEKAEKAEKSEEEPKKEEAELKKPSPVNQAIETICGLVCKAIGAVQCAVTKVLSIVNLVKAKILSLPWDCIISLLTTLGVTGGMTLAYWTLTEDMAVFVAPSVAILGPYVLEKLQEKQLLNVKGAHLTGELLKTATLGVHYYIYRTYISLPF